MGRNQACSARDQLLKLAALLLETAEQLPEAEPVQIAPSARLVAESKLISQTGYSANQLKAMRRRGDVIEGVHYVKTPLGRIDWNTVEFEAWQRGDHRPDTLGSRSGTDTSEYASGMRGDGSMNVSTFRQRLQAVKRQREHVPSSTVIVEEG